MKPIEPGTKLPWKLLGDCPNIVGADGEYVCGNTRGGNVRAFVEIGNSDMRYIVHSANFYPQMLAALEALVVLEDEIDGKCSYCNGCHWSGKSQHCPVYLARRVLAEARGE